MRPRRRCDSPSRGLPAMRCHSPSNCQSVHNHERYFHAEKQGKAKNKNKCLIHWKGGAPSTRRKRLISYIGKNKIRVSRYTRTVLKGKKSEIDMNERYSRRGPRVPGEKKEFPVFRSTLYEIVGHEVPGRLSFASFFHRKSRVCKRKLPIDCTLMKVPSQ